MKTMKLGKQEGSGNTDTAAKPKTPSPILESHLVGGER